MGVEIGIDRDKTIETLKEHLIASKTFNSANAEEIKKLKKDIERASESNTHFEGKSKNVTIQKNNMIIDRDIYEKSRESFILEKFNERILDTLKTKVTQQIDAKEEVVPSSEVSALFLQQFQILVRETNLKDNIKKDLLESIAVRRKLTELILEREITQNNLIHAIKEKRFAVADLQLKMSFIERIDQGESISTPHINIETMRFLKNVFPDEKVLELASKYGKHEGDYLDHLSQRVMQYQAWKKEGSIEDLKENVRKEILRLTNPKEYDMLLEKEENKQTHSKGKGLGR